MKTHLLRCARKHKNEQAGKQLTIAMQEQGWSCKWAKCTSNGFDNSSVAVAHVTDHLEAQSTACNWDAYDRIVNNAVELHLHLLEAHGVHTSATTPTRSRFCFECGSWISSEMAWELHASNHSRNPHIIYGPVVIDGMIAAPRRCPYCISQGVFLQMENHTQYLAHIMDHISEDCSNKLQCPHPTCKTHFYVRKELEEHFRVIHRIPLS